jgi:NitT/TauT family transport system ATP-binding protein
MESVFLSQRVVVMAPRPGRVAQEIRIDAPYPRDESWRASAAFAASCVQVSQALQRAVESAEEAAHA